MGDMIDVRTVVLLTPINDPESVTIRRIADAFEIPVLVSKQPHGATLAKESKLLARIQETNPNAQTIVIVEIPGLKEEDELRQTGMKVEIIDHHRYGEIDRTNNISSLEQFLAYFKISLDELRLKGFDPLLIQGVADMDQGFVWKVKSRNHTKDDEERIFEHYHHLLLELGGEKRKEQEAIAVRAFEQRIEEDRYVFVENPVHGIGIRDALSFEVAKFYGRPTTLILHENRIIYVQETSKALELLEKFGGFTYGGDTCWGIWQKEGQNILEEVKQIVGRDLV